MPEYNSKNEGLGPLHTMLRKGLPDYEVDGVFDVKTFAHGLNRSYQAVYRWFTKDSFPPKLIDTVIGMSNASKRKPEGFKPLVRDDFWPFIAMKK